MGRGRSHDDGWAFHLHSLFVLPKENGPHPQGVCCIRKRHSRQRLRNGRSKRNAGRDLARSHKFASIRGSSEPFRPSEEVPLPARAVPWQLKDIPRESGAEVALLVLVEIACFLLALPWRWLRASRPKAPG